MDVIESTLNEHDFEQDEAEQELPASTEDDSTEELPTGDEDAPAEEPEEPSAPSETDELRKMVADMKEREERYLALLEKTNTPPPAQQEAEPDPMQILEDNFDGDTLVAMKAVVSSLEKRYARAADVASVQTTTHQMSIQREEEAAKAEFVSKGVPQADVDEAHRRIYDRFNKKGPNPEWPTPRAAYRDVLNEIMIERNYAKADKAVAAKQAVRERQAKTATPETVTPAGSGKVKVDVMELRKKYGRKLTTAELIAESEKAG